MRLSERSVELLRLLSERMNIPMSAVMELAIAEKARREKVE